MAKNIVVFSDGTGQAGGKGHNTNVYKLFNMIEDRTPGQTAFYDRGLGTNWNKITGSGTGLGISKNIRECYEFIFNNFESGDSIFLFGFSRGATTIRSLSSFIHVFGILPQSRPELIKNAYKIYRMSDRARRDAAAAEFLKLHHTMWCRIKFVGVWDTVAALGIPFEKIDKAVNMVPFFRHDFFDLRLSDSVENGYHALAIDDERLTFHPTPWREHPKVRQVWFSGMHTDVGGGYAEPQLSDIALEWMTVNAVKHGLRLYSKHPVKLDPDPDGFMHDSRGNGFAKFYRRKKRSWDAAANGRPVVHESVTLRRKNEQNKDDPPYNPWILALDPEIERWERLK